MTSEKPSKCCSTRENGLPCRYGANYERGGQWYCGIHDPKALAERLEISEEQKKAQWSEARSRPEKFCRRCGVSKPRADFCKCRCKKDGLQDLCRNCTSVVMKSRRLENPKQGRGRCRLRRLGVSPADYDKWLAEQGGKCAVCCREPSLGRGLHVDHDHKTGKIRELLCTNCNLTLGLVHDSPSWLRMLARYLEKHL